MANVADTLLERHLRNTAFPFVTAPAPTDTTPKFVAGSNLMTSYKGYIERRPGFDVGLESSPTTFTDPIVRTFCWRRWGGAFYIMLCTVGSVANVWKLNVGSDASFVLIWTSASSEPFDFVVSNNFCFFGNGTDMKKFDGTTVWNWGIAIGSISAGTSLYCGTGADGGGANAWANPTRIQGAPNLSYSTNTITCPPGGSFGSGIQTNPINGTAYSFAVGGTVSIVGIQVTITGLQSIVSNGGRIVGIKANLLYSGVTIGTTHISVLPLSAGTAVLGASNDTWGVSLTPSIINDPSFGVQVIGYISNHYSSPSATCTFSLDAAQITVFSLGGPAISVSGSVGTFSAANGGYQYVFCYYNATTGHVSSPTQPSLSTGNFTNKLNVSITLTASSDPQVTNIRLFRTTDGGGGIYFEVAGSPYPNASGPVTDNTPDASLSLITAPTFGFNDPPPPQKGFVWYSNRIWGFNNATLYFTDWEEMNIGVPEEGSVSGPAGNFWNFSSEITGLSVAQNGVIVFCAGHIYLISGDSLDTFCRSVIADGIGCRQRATITRLGGLTAFLANTNSIWTTDSTSLTEISQGIQPTLDNIDYTQASMAFHVQGQYRWLLLCDQGHSQTIPYDINVQQWMPPWSIVGQGVSSGETSPGVYTLLLGQQGTNKMLQMIPGQYTDNGSTYACTAYTNLIPLVNEHLSSGSPIIDLFYPQAPGHVSYFEYVGMDTNAILPTNVQFLADDDPSTGTYTDITANIKDAPLKAQGVNVLDKWYYARKPTMKRVSLRLSWAGATTNFKVYSLSLAYRVYR